MKNKSNIPMLEIKFYSLNDAYGEFSNFAKYPIKIGGKIWPTTEHFWGDGGNGKGKNMLGKLLMEVRELLRSGKI